MIFWSRRVREIGVEPAARSYAITATFLINLIADSDNAMGRITHSRLLIQLVQDPVQVPAALFVLYIEQSVFPVSATEQAIEEGTVDNPQSTIRSAPAVVLSALQKLT